MLAITIARAKEDDQIKGIVPHFIQDGLSLLQHVDQQQQQQQQSLLSPKQVGVG